MRVSADGKTAVRRQRQGARLAQPPADGAAAEARARTRTTTSAPSRSSTCPTTAQLADVHRRRSTPTTAWPTASPAWRSRGPTPSRCRCPQRHGEPSVFKHVIYVIKENRTYDQVFGDMKEGNGDPNLVHVRRGGDARTTTSWPASSRCSTTSIAAACSAPTATRGCNEAYVTDYLEKAFGGFTRSYPYEGSDPLAFAASGFLWDNALAQQEDVPQLSASSSRAAAAAGNDLDGYVP